MNCDKCKKEIDARMYVKLRPNLIPQDYMGKTPPMMFSCPEHEENYTKCINLHDNCFMILLRELGVQIHNMKEVIEKYNNLKKDKNSVDS